MSSRPAATLASNPSDPCVADPYMPTVDVTSDRERLTATFAAVAPFIAGLWLLILGGLLWAFALSREWTGASGDMAALSVARDLWATLQAWSAQPPLGLVVALVVALLLTWYALAARWTLIVRQRRAYAAEYILRPVRRVSGDDIVPRYVRQVYLTRKEAQTGQDLDHAARELLRTTSAQALRDSSAPLGVCIVGAAMQGKTRLAWEALRAALPGWTLLRWPQEPALPFEFAAVRGKRLVLWIDDLHQFATPTTAAALADIPRRCAEVGAHVIVVATCREGRDERRARRHLGGMLSLLTVLRLDNISEGEADLLTAALTKAGASVERDQFNGTPGSLLLPVRRMLRVEFPALPIHARRVLHTLNLLRSAQIYRYPVSRVLTVAIDLFGAAPIALEDACATLEQRGWLRSRMMPGAGERELVPVSDVFIEQSIKDYLSPHAEISDDWPSLMVTLERRRDVSALRRLGNTFTELIKGVGPLLPYDVGAFKDQGITCLRAALQACSPRDDALLWAVTQLDLGYSLTARAEVATGVTRADLWRQAVAAHRAALDALPPGSSPAYAALAQIRLAEIAHQQAGDALYAGDMNTACRHLNTALAAVTIAHTFYTPHADPVRHRELVALGSAIETTQWDISCDLADCGC